jgi:kumamolisin
MQAHPRKHVTLKGSRRSHRPGAQVLGRADPHEWCEITVKLRRQTPLPEPQPGRAVLTREEAAKKHGASAADIEAVVKSLTGYGLTLLIKDPATRSVKLAGPVERMETIFKTHLFRVKHGGRLYRGRVGELSLPAELQGIVEGVFGLDTRPMIRSRRPRTQMQSAPSAQLPPPDQRPWYLPQELAAAYNFPGTGAAGKTVGIIELGGQYLAADLREFAALTGLEPVPAVNVVNVEKLAPSERNDPDAIGEVMLDVEVVAGVCPGAAIALYFSNFTEKGWVDVIDAALNDAANDPCVLSISYGLAEGAEIWTQQAMDAVNDAMKEAAARGIPVCVAAGDDGSDDQVGDGLAHVNFPASSPYVLGVGGTTLKKGANGAAEAVWFDGDGLRRDQGGSTGGGVSSAFPRPPWQASFTIASVNPNALPGRIVPDVAADAAGSTGYFMVAQGQGQVSGGTSAATPLWAGLIARLIRAHLPVGYLTPVFYQPAANAGASTIGALACNDITKGDNNTAAAGGYSAGIGYDAVTGWGSPKGDALASLLSTLPAPPVSAGGAETVVTASSETLHSPRRGR